LTLTNTQTTADISYAIKRGYLVSIWLCTVQQHLLVCRKPSFQVRNNRLFCWSQVLWKQSQTIADGTCSFKWQLQGKNESPKL